MKAGGTGKNSHETAGKKTCDRTVRQACSRGDSSLNCSTRIAQEAQRTNKENERRLNWSIGGMVRGRRKWRVGSGDGGKQN